MSEPLTGFPERDVVTEGTRIVRAAAEQRVPLRPIGGVAVRLRTGDELPAPLIRDCADIDLVTTRKARTQVAALLRQLGYEPNERFNAINGADRLMFHDHRNQRDVDVFVGEFRMCHRIPITDRLELDPMTVPLAELLLTKLQIVRTNEKDARDVVAVLLRYDVGETDEDTVNAGYVASLLADDWGLWRTTRQSVATITSLVPTLGLGAPDQALVVDRLTRLWARIDAEPKSLRWRARSRVGDRKRWYEEPEDTDHTPTLVT